ncbi:DUF6343 family protein [Umezawaea beigongshangensis]|uniref:DUF6343 family protein n=1 Tax=Umezawaea beigongshangensis TaxID=2780383 RepID=UPI0018F1153C|nr:DUF6343 family protein [Umezawaea beigongshangensis]
MEKRKLSREDYERGLPGYHDPTAGLGGSAPARSALTLRLWLAGFGLVMAVVFAVLAARADFTVLVVVMVVLAVVCAVDIGWIAYRKRRGEPG